jgi:di/tricarboxylate transporter
LGGAATYFTTANIIVSNLLLTANPPQKPLSILDFTPTGGLIAIAGIFYLAFLGKRLLPDRNPTSENLMTRPTGSQLESYYQLGERLWEARLLPGSHFDGKKLQETGIGERFGLAVAAIFHDGHSIFSPSPNDVLHAGDILVVVGREDRVSQLTAEGLAIGREGIQGPLSRRGVTFVEAMPAPHSKVEGRTLKALNFRNQYGFTAVALWRMNRSYRTNVADFPLQLGDSLLMIGSPHKLRQLRKNPDFIVLESSLSDQPVDRRAAYLAGGAILAGVISSVAGFPVYLAMLAAAIFVVITGVIRMEDAYQAVEWQAIFLIAGMYTVSLAMVQTGLANLLGGVMLALVRPLGTLGLAAGAFLLSSLLTQVMGGQVTALVTGPIAISAAISLGTSAQAIAVATAIGCSASFFTPMAHPVNILMMAPANYTFRDFFRVGWLLSLVSFIMLLVGMVLFWGLSLGRLSL